MGNPWFSMQGLAMTLSKKQQLKYRPAEKNLNRTGSCD
jgi:hypothetical protein